MTDHDFPSQDEISWSLLREIERRGGSIVVSECGHEIAELLADEFELTDSQREMEMNDGRNHWWNWVRWARKRRVETGHLSNRYRGVWTITDKGHAAIQPISSR